jgi:hypothetical protein
VEIEEEGIHGKGKRKKNGISCKQGERALYV